MERLLELHRKMRSKLCKEIFGHSMAVIVFSGLVIVALVDVLRHKQRDVQKLLAALLGIGHFGLCATAILHLKYCGVMEMNPLKCKVWIYLEVYNIAATTTFIVVATRYILPAPFHQWTGTALLLIIYWLPLIMYKTSQVCRMLEFISVLNFLQDKSLQSIRKHCCTKANTADNFVSRHAPCALKTTVSNAPNKVPFTTVTTTSREVVPPLTIPLNRNLSASTPQIPYEWTLIDSINNVI